MVEAVSIEMQPIMTIEFDHMKFICSTTHKFYINSNWVEAQYLNVGDVVSGHTVKEIFNNGNLGQVVRITVKDAHTYICEDMLAHNKMMIDFAQMASYDDR